MFDDVAFDTAPIESLAQSHLPPSASLRRCTDSDGALPSMGGRLSTAATTNYYTDIG